MHPMYKRGLKIMLLFTMFDSQCRIILCHRMPTLKRTYFLLLSLYFARDFKTQVSWWCTFKVESCIFVEKWFESLDIFYPTLPRVHCVCNTSLKLSLARSFALCSLFLERTWRKRIQVLRRVGDENWIIPVSDILCLGSNVVECRSSTFAGGPHYNVST